MKRKSMPILGWVSTVGGLSLSGLAQAQTLTNAAFDSGGGSLTGWTTFNNVIPNVLAANVTPHSGTTVAKVFGSYSGGANYSGLFQDLPATPGQLWQASAYFRHNTGDSLVGTSNSVVLKIEFYRVVNGVYGTSDFLGETLVTALDANTATDVWVPEAVQATAPASTVAARVTVVFTQNGNGTGAVLVDDVAFAPGAAPPPPTWALIWSDEFDGATLDTTKWDVENDHPIKNNELEYYAPDEVYLQNGNLVLRSRQRTYSGYDTNGNYGTWNYTSGLVRTLGRFATAYGKIEVRAKLPSTKGIWPAHWTLPDAGEWPPEIDIMEIKGSQPNTVYMTNHYGTYPNVQHSGGTYTGPNYALDYHTFAVEWSPTKIDWKIDDVLQFTSTSGVPHEPFYIILNTAVGGDFDGNPNGTTIFPQYHMIDYVRVYVPADPGTPLLTFSDPTPQTATVDGVINPGEYAFNTFGINTGSMDMLGRNTQFSIDSSGDGRLNFGIKSVTAWPQTGPYGAVIYFDTQAGGWPSTNSFHDTTTRAKRMASGKSTSTAKSDLYFAGGIMPDYALVLEPNNATVLRLDPNGHQVINGAVLGGTDLYGGSAVRYALDDGSGGYRTREVEIQLSQLGLRPGAAFDCIATFLNGDTAFRMNEFVGVSPGNAFDSVNPGQTGAVLKPGDFIRFTTAPPACGTGCNVGNDPADVTGDCIVDLTDLSVVLSGYGLQSARHDQGDVNFDGVVDLVDLSELLAAYGTNCP